MNCWRLCCVTVQKQSCVGWWETLNCPKVWVWEWMEPCDELVTCPRSFPWRHQAPSGWFSLEKVECCGFKVKVQGRKIWDNCFQMSHFQSCAQSGLCFGLFVDFFVLFIYLFLPLQTMKAVGLAAAAAAQRFAPQTRTLLPPKPQ